MRRAWRYFLSSFGASLYDDDGLWVSLRSAARDTWRWWRRPVQPPLEWAEIVTTTLHNRSPQLIANITRNNALLARMLKDKP